MSQDTRSAVTILYLTGRKLRHTEEKSYRMNKTQKNYNMKITMIKTKTEEKNTTQQTFDQITFLQSGKTSCIKVRSKDKVSKAKVKR